MKVRGSSVIVAELSETEIGDAFHGREPEPAERCFHVVGMLWRDKKVLVLII